MALFIWGKIRVDIIALCVLVALFVLQLITPEQALYGFANQATITIAAMFVLSAGLVRTGLVEWVARQLDRLAGKAELRLMLVLCLTAAILSAFIINTAIVAIFIPVAMVLARILVSSWLEVAMSRSDFPARVSVNPRKVAPFPRQASTSVASSTAPSAFWFSSTIVTLCPSPTRTEVMYFPTSPMPMTMMSTSTHLWK